MMFLNPYRFGGGGGGGGSDPDFANVVLLVGASSGGFTCEKTGKTATVTGTATVSSAQAIFGASSFEIQSSAANRVDWSSTDFNFGTADFTVEGWFRPDATTNRAFFSYGAWLVYTASGGFTYFNGSNAISSGVITNNTWYHVAITRASGIVRLFVAGTAFGFYGEAGAINPGAFRIGYYNGGNPAGRYYDEIRVTKNVARYTASFTPPSSAFPRS